MCYSGIEITVRLWYRLLLFMQCIQFCVVVGSRSELKSPFVAHFQLLVLGFANHWCVSCFSLCLTALIFSAQQQAHDSLFGWLMAAYLLTLHRIKRSRRWFPKVTAPVPAGDQSQQSNNKNSNQKSHTGLSHRKKSQLIRNAGYSLCFDLQPT